MHKIILRIFWFLAAIVILESASPVRGANLSPAVEKLIYDDIYRGDSLASVVIFLDNDSGQKEAARSAMIPHLTRNARHKMAVEALKRNHIPATSSVKKKILSLDPDANIKEFWIAPALQVTMHADRLKMLVGFSEIVAIYENGPIEIIKPVELSASAAKTGSVSSHLKSLNIPALWARGLTGKGRLVCNFDTGVEGTHPALTDKWRGNHTSGTASWFAPSSNYITPHDATGHGSHTMGLMVGSNEVDTFGVAPDAEWIAAAVVDQGETLSRTLADIVAAFEWAVDPDGNPATSDDVPDVILNSWGVPTTILEPCDATFNQVIDNAEAAGIVTIFAAGNEGPEPQSLRIPANRAATIYNAFAVGAIDGSNNIIASFSSRGPSSCSPSQKKPEVVAPGVGLYSCTKDGGYTYKNGTSMAAPLIAGLVTLLRQYNPEATVQEIKNAIILSARDLGPTGEDNDYGYGLPDAEKALRYIPAPIAEFVIKHHFIDGDGIAEPGETFGLRVGLETPSLAVDSASAILECTLPGVSILSNQSTYVFLNKGTYSVNMEPFIVEFSEELVNGTVIPMNLKVYLPYSGITDTLGLQVMVGIPLEGTMITHITSRIDYTITDFGQYGLGSNSVYAAGGAGFKFLGSENLLYESGLIVGRNSLQLSSSIRDSLGNAFNSDFSPLEQINVVSNDPHNGFISSAKFTDIGSDIPIPIAVNQKITSFDNSDEDGYIILEYTVVNNTNENMTNLFFGYFNDFDLSPNGDMIAFDQFRNLMYQNDGMRYIGVMPLGEYNGMVALDNGGVKRTFTNYEKYNLVSRSGIVCEENAVSDHMILLNFGPYYIPARDSIEIALILAAAESQDKLEQYADRARARYFGPTNVDNGNILLPGSFTLYQNYPNPFNPRTTISFNIPSATIVNLTVFNILGQNVKTLYNGLAQAGEHIIEWNGTDASGKMTGSGVYFYRLTTALKSESRKMLLIK